MTPAARLSAAIEVLGDVESRRRPVMDALKEWGLAHRFAGSGDRAAIAGLVHDALRVRASAAFVMGVTDRKGDEAAEGGALARSILLATLLQARGSSVAEIDALCSGERFAPEPLSGDERQRLSNASLEDAPPPVAGNYPAWLDSSLARAFGDARGAEMAAMTARAPLDLRVNALKALRPQAQAALKTLEAEPTPFSPFGLRVPSRADGRAPAITAEPAYLKGLVEIQDEGSQLAVLLAGARPGQQVLDLCAGGGGKTLALAAVMNNKGQIHATDNDPRRLAPIHDRLARAGARNVQVLTPRGRVPPIDDLAGRMDLVLIDAPCTGIGTWRRNPDAKWRIRPGSLEVRLGEQQAVLNLATSAVKPGGRLVYVTCSLLPEENGDQIAAFLARHANFMVRPPAEVAAEATLPDLAAHLDPSGVGLLLTPLRTGTDGFFVSVLQRS